MRAHQFPTMPPPRRWLMTDERMGNDLWRALDRLPRGAGIVFRHHATPAAERRALFGRIARIARRRGLLLVLAGPARDAVGWGAAGMHLRGPARTPRPLLRTMPVHDRRQAVAARRARADLVFVSPVFATRSHARARPLGRGGLAALARASGAPAVALGGMDARRARTLRGAYGWAAIDAWLTG